MSDWQQVMSLVQPRGLKLGWGLSWAQVCELVPGLPGHTQPPGYRWQSPPVTTTATFSGLLPSASEIVLPAYHQFFRWGWRRWSVGPEDLGGVVPCGSEFVALANIHEMVAAGQPPATLVLALP